DPLPSTLYGLRYTYGHPTNSTPAIVLVHGIASSTANWDFTPSWSVARQLARAGFVVISYDRLVVGKSLFDRPTGASVLQIPNKRAGAVVQQQITNVVVPALVAGDDYVPFFANQQQCVQFNIYPPGAVKRVVSIACDPANFVLTPAGEFTGFTALEQENDQFIKTTGNIPVLLTYGDHDAAFPPSTTQADYQYWVTNCQGCDVTEWSEPNSGHLFMAHTSLPQWMQAVV